MTTKMLIHNARVHTQASGMVVDSLAVNRSTVVAVGANLQHDPDFRAYPRVNLRGRAVIPGFVDAHTHFYFFALSLGRVSLDGLTSLPSCLRKVRRFVSALKTANEWVVGEGYSPDRFSLRQEPNRRLLDQVTGRHPAFIFSKDQHTAWVNTRALEIAGVGTTSPEPKGGRIERFDDGSPSGILRESPAFLPVLRCVPSPPQKEVDRRYRLALDIAYRKGVTGIHSFDDSPEAFEHFARWAERGRLELRITYYPPASVTSGLAAHGVRYGSGDDFLRVAGVKIFADGSLGSQSALCFNRYLGTKENYGIEVLSVTQIKRALRAAARLGLPAAIHAIGDRAVVNVLDAIEATPALRSGARHRIEHLQLVRRKDLARVKRLGVVASMQPSHCPSDIKLVRKYWGKRSANAFAFRTIKDRGIDLAFGSDVPIEPLDPLDGIAAAVRRALPNSRDILHPEQRLTAAEALYHFTVGPAIAAGQELCRGYLLPGYPADFVVLSEDVTRLAPGRIYQARVLATVLDGQIKYCHRTLNL